MSSSKSSAKVVAPGSMTPKGAAGARPTTPEPTVKATAKATEGPYDWLKSQLPKDLSWGMPSIKISIKDAPKGEKGVRSMFASLDQVDAENTDRVLRRVSADVAYSDKTTITLTAIPQSPSKWIKVGVYRIAWTINYDDKSNVSSASKIYRGLSKAPATLEE